MKNIKALLIGIFMGMLLFSVLISGEDVQPIRSTAPEVLALPTNTLLDLHNLEREKMGLEPLKEDERLNRSAQMKANDMCKHNYFSHTNSDDTQPWKWFDQAGYDNVPGVRGENISKGFSNIGVLIMEALMNSKGHRENVLYEEYEEIGIGRCDDYTVFHYGKPIPTMKITRVIAN